MKRLLLLLLFPLTAFAGICDQAGVFVCETFADAGSLSGAIRSLYGDSVKVENGLLRFTIKSQTGADIGDFRPSFGATSITEGESVYFAYRLRADKTAIDRNGAATHRWPDRKTHILWRGSSSCTDLEFTGKTRYRAEGGYSLVAYHTYTNCGTRNPDYSIGGGDYAEQFPDYTLNYHDPGLAPQDPAYPKPDIWEDFYFEVTVGTFGGSDSTLVAWHRWEGTTYRRYLYTTTYNITGSGGYDHFMLTTYMTGKDPTEAHEIAYVDFDYLVMSTSPLDKDILAAEPYTEVLPQSAKVHKTSRICFGGSCLDIRTD